MLRKVATLVAFGAGAWIGYSYAMEVVHVYGIDVSGYWGEQGAEFIRIVLTCALGGICALSAYFVMNLFARFDH